jgi:ATP sulfurylase
MINEKLHEPEHPENIKSLENKFCSLSLGTTEILVLRFRDINSVINGFRHPYTKLSTRKCLKNVLKTVSISSSVNFRIPKSILDDVIVYLKS